MTNQASDRLAVLLAEDREEKLTSYEAFKVGGDPRVLETPTWRREAVLERERRLREASC